MHTVSTILPVLLACALAPGLPAQGSADCPDVRASNVPAHVKHAGEYTRCGFGITVLGIPISLGGGKCFPNEFIYPAHQECLGAPNEGTACVPAPDMPVQQNLCECLALAILGTGISVPKCSCSSVGTAGMIEDAETALCHVST